VPVAEMLGKITGNDSPKTSDDSPEINGTVFGDGPDPAPKRPEGKHREKAPVARVPPHQRKEVEEKLGAMIEFFQLGWEQRDPYCAGKLADQQEEITKRATAIICKRPKMLAWFLDSSDWSDWLMLATALQPVTVAIWAHHIAKSAGDEETDAEMGKYAAPEF
jgi:hypothetical protein